MDLNPIKWRLSDLGLAEGKRRSVPHETGFGWY
jgi:hypothetical protein